MLVDSYDRFTSDDPMLRWRRSYYRDLPNHEYESQSQKPYFLITHQTLFCGTIAAATCLMMQAISIRLADKLYDVTAVLHLHNALKKEGCISAPIPMLEALEKLYEPENIFLGEAPSKPQAYRNHYLVILGFSLKYFAAGKPRKGSTKRVNDKTRPRDLMQLRPTMQALKNEFCPTAEQANTHSSDLIKLVQERKNASPKKLRSSPSKPSSPQQDINADPIAFLTNLRDRIKEEQPRLDASFYNAYFTCNRLLQEIVTSKMVKKRFCKQYNLDKNDLHGEAFMTRLHWVPLFLFERHLDDPKGKWLASVGETVEKFFSSWEMGEEDLRRGCWPTKEGADEKAAMDLAVELSTDLAMGFGGDGYGGGKWEIDERWHPVKDGRCYHVGVCELMVKEWRRLAGLEVDVEEAEREEEEEEEGCGEERNEDEEEEWFSCEEAVD